MIEACDFEQPDDGISNTLPNYKFNRKRAKRLLRKLDPLRQYRTMKLISSEFFLGRASDVTMKALTAAVELSKELEPWRPKWSRESLEKSVTYLAGDSHMTPIVFDTGASYSVTPHLSDFITDLDHSPSENITGVGDHKTPIKGIGKVRWTIRDIFGRIGTIETNAYYVPDITIRLFSPQACFQEGKRNEGSFSGDKDKITLFLPNKDPLEFPYQCGSNLPFMLMNEQQFVHTSHTAGFCEDEPHDPVHICNCVLEQMNQNLAGPQKELLLWHWRLGHAGFEWVQRLGATLLGVHAPARLDIKFKTVPTLRREDYPLCAACKLGRAKRVTPKSESSSRTQPQEMQIRADDLLPGDYVSADQYVSAVHGRLPHTAGREADKDKYNGGTIFVDHASSFVYMRNQVSLRMGETLKAKAGFEQFAARFGITLKKFRADNHPFNAAPFKADLELKHQTVDYSGVGAHHQNGVAERAIKQITEWARTMMLHSAIHWPESADAALWPFAVEHAVYLWNNLPRPDNGLSPLEVFTGVTQPTQSPLQNARVWGCPVFVLDPKLQDGKKLPKWQPRSRQGMYLGTSASHSTSVGRILNMRTGFLSPQYHVVYDERFSTVYAGPLGPDEQFDPDMWRTLVDIGLENTLDPADIRQAPDGSILVPFSDWFESWLSPDELIPPPTASEGEEDDTGQQPTADLEALNEGTTLDAGTPDARHLPPLGGGGRRTRSGRRFANFADTYMKQKIRQERINSAKIQSLDWNKAVDMIRSKDTQAMFSLMDSYIDPDEGTQEDWHPFALQAKATDEDTPTWEEAMNGPFREGFEEACRKELDTLIEMGVWDVVDRKRFMNVLPSTWAFRIKRYPGGLMKKLKSRFCVRGDRQIEGIDFGAHDTYAPVVQWSTIRVLLILTVILKLESVQVDYTAAFVHAPIGKHEVYCEMPKGHTIDGKVLKLKKSLYGLRQSPRNFYQHLRTKLESIGFECQTDVDPCLFVSDKVICVIHVDDTLLVSPDKKHIEDTIEALRKAGMKLEVEDDMAGFLGVQITPDEQNGTVTLTQVGLAKRIVEALNLGNRPTKETPADSVLVADVDGEPAKGTYSYASVIGMMWYYYGHSRPDIGFAVSQCARFSHSPRRSHELALEQIGLYIKGTIDKGLILKPDREHINLDVYVDSDFCGLYGKEDRRDSTCVKSRTGFVICLANCPVIWKSTLQPQVTLSTMMSEYYALSSAMKEVLPLQDLLKVMKKGVGLPEDFETTFMTTVWEDNIGALTLANLDPGQSTPRSKFYDIKVHWFREHLGPRRITVKKIDTKDQKADIFTKPLVPVLFKRLRKLLCGW